MDFDRTADVGILTRSLRLLGTFLGTILTYLLVTLFGVRTDSRGLLTGKLRIYDSGDTITLYVRSLGGTYLPAFRLVKTTPKEWDSTYYCIKHDEEYRGVDCYTLKNVVPYGLPIDEEFVNVENLLRRLNMEIYWYHDSSFIMHKGGEMDAVIGL